jgi:trans-aconitate methyltransferase
MKQRTVWDAQLYDQKHAFVAEYGKGLIEWLAPKPGERILDLGCGTGHLAYEIAQAGCEVVGMDASAEMVEQARRAFPELHFEVGDAADFSFTEPFDAIFSNATLHWVLDYQAAIACMYRHLKPGGRLVLEMGGAGNIEQIIRQLRTELQNCGYRAQSELQLWFFPGIGTYTSALEAAGFQVEIAQHYDRPTQLQSSAHGVEDWLSMFAGAFFEGIPEGKAAEIRAQVQAAARPHLFRDGHWYADYKRLRVMAVKPLRADKD